MYRIRCKDCEGVYIGQTKQLLKNRVNEHKNSCQEKYRNKKEGTALALHHFTHEHSFDFENPEIIDRETNYSKRLVSEMVLIRIDPQTVNLRTDTEHLSRIYRNLICNYIKI